MFVVNDKEAARRWKSWKSGKCGEDIVYIPIVPHKAVAKFQK